MSTKRATRSSRAKTFDFGRKEHFTYVAPEQYTKDHSSICAKILYATRSKAKRAIRKSRKSNLDRKLYYYKCPHCPGYHLTSQSPSKDEKSKDLKMQPEALKCSFDFCGTEGILQVFMIQKHEINVQVTL